MSTIAKPGINPAIASEKNLMAALLKAAALYPETKAQYEKDGRGEYTQCRTLPEMVAAAQRCAGHLAHLGLKEGGRLGILGDNSACWNLADLAAAMNRCATVGFYTNDSPEDIAYKIHDASVEILCLDTLERLKTVRAIPQEKIPTLKTIIGWGEAEKGGEGVIPFSSLLTPSPFSVQERLEKIHPHDLVKIIYTSGTSGPPKGAMLTHDNILSNVISASHYVVLSQGDVLISYLPSAHIFQAFLDYAAWLNGAGLGYAHRKTLREDLPRLRPHFFPGVPKVYKMLLEGIAQKIEEISQGKVNLFADTFQKEVFAPMIKAAAGLDRVRFFVSGAAKLDVEVARILEEKLDIVIYEGYGLSETSPVISLNTPKARKLGTVGKPIPGVEVQIVDEDRSPLPPGQKGEIAVKGPNVFLGYLHKEEATKKVLSNGWFYTGDRGMLDEEGYLTVFGRASHRVKFANGEYYDLEEIGDKFLRKAKLIGQIVVAGEQKDSTVALITLAEDLQVAQAIAQKEGIAFQHPRELIYHPQIIALVKEEFESIQASYHGNNPYERIEKALYLRPFSAENKEATPTQKTRIRYVLDKYEQEIEKLYQSPENFKVLYINDEG